MESEATSSGIRLQAGEIGCSQSQASVAPTLSPMGSVSWATGAELPASPQKAMHRAGGAGRGGGGGESRVNQESKGAGKQKTQM